MVPHNFWRHLSGELYQYKFFSGIRKTDCSLALWQSWGHRTACLVEGNYSILSTPILQKSLVVVDHSWKHIYHHAYSERELRSAQVLTNNRRGRVSGRCLPRMLCLGPSWSSHCLSTKFSECATIKYDRKCRKSKCKTHARIHQVLTMIGEPYWSLRSTRWNCFSFWLSL